MSNNDQLIDTPELRELRDSMSGVALPERPRLEAITAKGRGRRRRRLAGVPVVSAVAAAAVVTLSLGLPGVHSRARTPGTIRTLGMIRTAAFTIHANPSGTATLTINPKEFLTPLPCRATSRDTAYRQRSPSAASARPIPRPPAFRGSCHSNAPVGNGAGSLRSDACH